MRQFRPLPFLLIALAFIPPAAAQTSIRPGTIALILIDRSQKVEQAESQDTSILAAMAREFSQQCGLVALPREDINATRGSLRSPRTMDSESLPEAIALGRSLEAEAIAVAAHAVAEGKAALTIRLYDTVAGRKVDNCSIFADADRIVEQIGDGVAKLCATWAGRKNLEKESNAESSTATHFASVTVLAGYRTLASMNWEVEASLPKSPFSFGLEFSYERIDSIAIPGDILALTLIGRWWPLTPAEKKGLVILLGAGASFDVVYGLQAGPFIGAVGWSFMLAEGSGPVTLASRLRLEPEIGISWSERPRWEGILIRGFLPFVGLKIGL
jgi:hypothetical protein